MRKATSARPPRTFPAPAASAAFAFLCIASSPVVLGACGKGSDPAPVFDRQGLLGSCLAKEAFYFQGNKEQVLSSCTEHAYESRGTDDPAAWLREDYAASCKARGFAWSERGCPETGVECERDEESLDRREGMATHRWTTRWYGEQGLPLKSSEHKKILCPE